MLKIFCVFAIVCSCCIPYAYGESYAGFIATPLVDGTGDKVAYLDRDIRFEDATDVLEAAETPRDAGRQEDLWGISPLTDQIETFILSTETVSRSI